jgi:hypothetical protein
MLIEKSGGEPWSSSGLREQFPFQEYLGVSWPRRRGGIRREPYFQNPA